MRTMHDENCVYHICVAAWQTRLNNRIYEWDSGNTEEHRRWERC